MYEKLGFERGPTRVDYEYVFRNRRYHKSRFRKAQLARMLGDDYDPSMTEREITQSLNIPRIYNAGRTTWTFGRPVAAEDQGGRKVEFSELRVHVKRHLGKVEKTTCRSSACAPARWPPT